MRKLKALLCAVTLALALGADLSHAGIFNPKPEDLKPRAHRIGIVSVIGDWVDSYYPEGAAVVKGGATDFGSLLPGAGFDATAEAAMRQKLERDIPDVTILTIDVPRDTLTHDLIAGPLGDGGLHRVRDDLEGWVKANDVDFVVIVTRSLGTSSFYYGGTPFNSHFTYYGVGFQSFDPFATRAYLGVMVCDGKSLDRLVEKSVADTLTSDVAWKDIPADQQPVQLARAINAVIQDAVPPLLEQAGL